MFYVGKPKSKFMRRFVGVYCALAIIAVAFVGGMYVGGSYGTIGEAPIEGGKVKGKDEIPPYLLQDVDFNLFWEVWDFIKDKYLEQPVLDTELFYGALRGIVGALGDPYSTFLEPELTKKFTEELSGTFEGIGAEIGIKKERLVIVAPLPGSPAELAGLRSADHIVTIDALETQGMPLDVAVLHIRGKKGTAVKLTIFREGFEEPKEITIVRDTINVKSVTWKEIGDKKIAHLKIIYFNETTPALFEEAVQAILAKDSRGIILDLRNNPGGFLEVGVQVASAWVPRGQAVVYQEFQGGKQEAFRSAAVPRLRGIPTVVLVNGGSASASEIVAGALRDHRAAKLVGEHTFGKGSVQTFERLRGGSSIKLTVAHWLTPSGQKINGEGIAPEVEVKVTRDDLDQDRDPQFEKAVELLMQ